MATSAPVAHVIGVKMLKTSDLNPNPHNPRVLFDRIDMDPLRDSIRRSGILVPLTVFQEKKSKKYVILDGQRRWICAQEVGLKKVPVNEVEEPGLVENIVTMFQIHKLRKDWELMPTALKLELLMEETKDRSERRLAALTGLDQAMVVRCKKLLSFSKKYQDMMLDIDPNKRVKADFFIELWSVLHDRQIKKYDWFKPGAFTDKMLVKHQSKALRSVTDFRVVKQQLNNSVKANRTVVMGKRLREFMEQPKLTIQHLAIDEIDTSASARKLVKAATELHGAIKDLDSQKYYGERVLWESLEKLLDIIKVKLLEVDRRSAK